MTIQKQTTNSLTTQVFQISIILSDLIYEIYPRYMTCLYKHNYFIEIIYTQF